MISESNGSSEAAQVAVECSCAASAYGDWIVFLTPAILVVSVLAAFIGVKWNRKIARIRATLDLIIRTESTRYYQECHKAFKSRRLSGKGFDDLHDLEKAYKKERGQLEQERQNIIDYLNHYEIVVLGFQNGILDKDFYHDWIYYAFARDWDAAANFIQRERWSEKDGEWEYFDELYKNYQEVALEWGATHNLNEEWSPHP